MPVIALLNQKGGVGKTTLSLHIAYQLSLTHSTQLIDADPQGSSLDWAAMRQTASPFNVIGVPKPNIHLNIASLSKAYDWTVIDGPPRVNDIAVSAISASDLILIPVTPSPLDVWAAKEIIDLIHKVKIYRPHLQARFLINRHVPNTQLGREVTDALAAFEDIPVLETVIPNRAEFAKAPRNGQTAKETEPHGKSAAAIEALVNELLNTPQGGTK